MKWLAMLFRESMVQFFGKTGIAWHGAMICRLATEAEAEVAGTGAGSMRVEYHDAVCDDAKECGFNVQSQLEACLRAYKSNVANSHITKVRFIDFDGARCYIGKYLTAAVPLLALAICMPIAHITIGEAGCNKTPQDGHFASAGQAVKAVVASGDQDVEDASSLHQAQAKANMNSTFALHTKLQRAKAGKLSSSASSSGVTVSKSHYRHYQYDGDI